MVWTGSVRWGNFTQALRALKLEDGADEAYYYGLIQPAETFEQYCGNSCTTGQSYTVSSASATSYRVGAGLGYSGERWAWTLAHELGHMHGRGHAPCGVSWWSRDRSYPYGGGLVGVRGWDARGDRIWGADEATDFMGYCGNQWVSDYTYQGLLDRMGEAHLLASSLMDAGAVRTWQSLHWSAAEAPMWGESTREVRPETGEVAGVRFLDEEGVVLEEIDAPLMRLSHQGGREVLVPKGPEGATRVLVEAAGENFMVTVPSRDGG